MNYATALRRLKNMVAYNVDPVLSDEDLQDCLSVGRRADVYNYAPDDYADWAASTAYAAGAIVVPTTRNGIYYTVTSAGTSGASEPAWTTTLGDEIVSGGVTFEATGVANWGGAWDLHAAAEEGWRIKAGRTSNRTNISTDGRSLSREQSYTHCNEQAEIHKNKKRPLSLFPGTASGRYQGSQSVYVPEDDNS